MGAVGPLSDTNQPVHPLCEAVRNLVVVESSSIIVKQKVTLFIIYTIILHVFIIIFYHSVVAIMIGAEPAIAYKLIIRPSTAKLASLQGSLSLFLREPANENKYIII